MPRSSGVVYQISLDWLESVTYTRKINHHELNHKFELGLLQFSCQTRDCYLRSARVSAATNLRPRFLACTQPQSPRLPMTLLTETARQKYRKHFIPLESNPDVFTELIHKLGLPTSLSFQDVWSLEPDLLAMIPRPVHALILAVPTTEGYEKQVHNEDAEVKAASDSETETNTIFFKQTINNACGLYAILHAICNGEARNKLGMT